MTEQAEVKPLHCETPHRLRKHIPVAISCWGIQTRVRQSAGFRSRSAENNSLEPCLTFRHTAPQSIPSSQQLQLKNRALSLDDLVAVNGDLGVWADFELLGTQLGFLSSDNQPSPTYHTQPKHSINNLAQY